MRTAISLSAEERSWDELVTYVLEAERLGVDICWVTEGWGGDAVSPLGFLAARTERIKLGSGVFQLGTRTPAAIAMAAMTIAMMSEGRFLLGLGASGPQVIGGCTASASTTRSVGCASRSRSSGCCAAASAAHMPVVTSSSRWRGARLGR